jgi:hypothetical protein
VPPVVAVEMSAMFNAELISARLCLVEVAVESTVVPARIVLVLGDGDFRDCRVLSDIKRGTRRCSVIFERSGILTDDY